MQCAWTMTINPTALRTAKPLWSFGRSECCRVKAHSTRDFGFISGIIFKKEICTCTWKSPWVCYYFECYQISLYRMVYIWNAFLRSSFLLICLQTKIRIIKQIVNVTDLYSRCAKGRISFTFDPRDNNISLGFIYHFNKHTLWVYEHWF